MLKPAIIYKEEIEKKFAEYLYTDRVFWYTGYGTCNEFPHIETKDGHYQWAIVDDVSYLLLGYFSYQIQTATDTVLNFGLFSFDAGTANLIVGRDVFKKMEELVSNHRRIEWRMIGGNSVKRSYDRFCEKMGGRCVKLTAVTKDINGKWHDEYIYEIVKES